MGDEAVKVQLFRFVDVLPMLGTPASITRHLREYFGEADGHVPGWIQGALRVLPSEGMLARLLAATSRQSARRLARRFIAGSNLDEALEAVSALCRRSLAFTVDLLGEATIAEAEAEGYQAQYFQLVE